MHAPIFANDCGKAGADAANGGGKYLAGDQIGLRVRSQIGHEVKEHEAGKDQHHLGAAVVVDRLGRDEETERATDETKYLQAHAADAVGEKDGAHDADEQKNVDESRALGGDHVVGHQIDDVLGMLALVAH